MRCSRAGSLSPGRAAAGLVFPRPPGPPRPKRVAMRAVAASLLLIVTACGSTTGERSPTPYDRNTLTQAEIQGASASNAYELVRELRPAWLRVRGSKSIAQVTEVSVFLDGMRLGGPDTLSGIRTSGIKEIRYLTAREAQTRYGMDNTGGAIIVRTRGE